MPELKYKKLLAELEAKRESGSLSISDEFAMYRLRHYCDAMELGLRYFRVSPGAYPSSLEFCAEKAGKIFSIDDLESWKNEEGRPNIMDYDPIIHFGGNKCFRGEEHCNHTFLFMTDDLAYQKRPDLNKEPQSSIEKNDLSHLLRPEYARVIQKRKSELLKSASPMKSMIINATFNRFINDLVGKDKIEHNDKAISIEEAVEFITQLISKVDTKGH